MRISSNSLRKFLLQYGSIVRDKREISSQILLSAKVIARARISDNYLKNALSCKLTALCPLPSSGGSLKGTHLVAPQDPALGYLLGQDHSLSLGGKIGYLHPLSLTNTSPTAGHYPLA